MTLKTLGKFSTGTTQSQEFAFYGFRGGINVKNAPQLVGDEDLTVAIDGYLRADGGFQMRNGMYKYNATATGGAGQLILARFYQDILNGATVIPETLKLIGQVGNNLYSIPAIGAWSLIGTVGSAAMPMTWTRIQNPNDPHYPSGLTDCMVICTGSGGPYVYDGTNLYTPAGWASAASAAYCAVVNGILWFGGIEAYPNQIFGTGDGIIQSMETLPAIRNFALSSAVTGLAAQGSGATAALVVGMNNGLSVLYGTGPSTFYRQDVPFQDGVTSGRTMVCDSGVVYYLGERAMYAFDGQTIPKSISDKIEPWILNDPFYQVGANFPMSSRNYSWSQVYNNRLHIGYISGTAATVPNTVLVYDFITKGWTVLQPSGGLSSMCLLDAPADSNPYTVIAGSASTGLPMTWDYVPPAAGSIAYDDAPTNTKPVLAMVQSKYFKIGTPGTNKALERVYPELLVSGNFSQPFSVITDYGAAQSETLLDNPVTVSTAGIWDASFWDEASFGGVTGFINFGPPASRLDFNGLQAESFSFGILQNAASAPWIWSGASGVYSQRGRT